MAKTKTLTVPKKGGFRKAAKRLQQRGFEESHKTKSDIVETALERFKIVSEAESAQREREVEDLRFDRGLVEDQWPEHIRNSRSGTIGSPARPCLVINKLSQPIQQIIAEARGSRLAIEIKARGDGANDDDATLRQGMIRAIEVESRAHLARQWALERAVKCGRGYYRILKTWANDDDNDIDLVVKRVKNQGSVYFDPYAEEQDCSDANWCIITSDIPISEFTRRWPTKDLPPNSTEKIESKTNMPAGWARSDTTVRVAEYFWVETTMRKRIVSVEGNFWKDDLKKNDPGMLDELIAGGARERNVPIRDVKWCVLNSDEILEEEDWDGRFIPVIPVIGKEYVVDGEETVYKGVVSDAKDSQRSYNYMRSSQVETVGLAPRAPYIMAAGQDEGYKDLWDNANHRNYTRLLYHPVSFEGHLVPPPQRNIQEPAIQAITMAVREADDDIKATTGRHDPSLGRNPRDQSGKAIERLQEQGSMGTSIYLDNLANISINYEARVILDLLPKVYDRPGRIQRLLGEEDTETHAMLNAPFIEGPDGKPQAVSDTDDVEGKEVKHYDLTKGSFGVVVSVGPSYKTQRDENSAVMKSILEAAPALTPMLADLWVEQMGGPFAEKAAKRLKDANPNIPKDGEEDDLPPEVQQQIQQAQQQYEELQQAYQELEQKVATDEVKAQAQMAIKQAEIAATAQKVEAEAQGKQIALAQEAEIKQADMASDERIAEAKIASDAELKREEFEHEAAMKDAELASKASLERELATMKIEADLEKARITKPAKRTINRNKATGLVESIEG